MQKAQVTKKKGVADMVIGKKDYEYLLNRIEMHEEHISELYGKINSMKEDVKLLQEIIKSTQERGTIEYDDSIMMNKDGLYDYQRYKRIHGGKGVDEE